MQHDDHVRKRKRSLRKGTHSCWACKRRKEKCTFEDSDICTGCLRRGSRCVSQRFADSDDAQATANTGVAATTAAATATRLQRIEDMVAQLSSQFQNRGQSENQGQLYTPPVTSSSVSSSPVPQTALSQTALPTTTTHNTFSSQITSSEASNSSIGLPVLARAQGLSQALQGSLPCPQDVQLLRQASARHPVLSTIHITKSYSTLRHDGIQPTDGVLPAPPLITSEPVLMARYMLQIAIFLQEMQSVMYPELDCLVEPAAVVMERCANAAINLVTRQDDLHGSIESLEGVILESIYQCNSGRLRLSWLASQRAMLLAQTMGLHLLGDNGSNSHPRDTLHLLDPSSTPPDLPHLWFRIVHYDLQLSRMLGLPPGAAGVTKDKNKSRGKSTIFPYDATSETPEGHLEHVYRDVMVLALTQRSSDQSLPDIKATQALDQELQRAANGVPSQWWLPPNLAESPSSPLKLFWDTRRLIVQMLHHDLRCQLNVPYMLAGGDVDRQRSEMARIACVHSAREVLSRFILLRDFNQTASSCRFANFLGLMAAITLVLAHLGGSSRRSHAPNQDEISFQVDSLLSHQAPSDRAMMEQALETMRSVGQSSGDTLCAQSAQVLHRLLDIHARNSLYMADDNAYVSVYAQSDSQTATTGPSTSVLEEGERMFVPYFGVMRIVRPSKDDAAREKPTTTTLDPRADSGSGYPQAIEAVNLVDPLLLDLRDEHWMSQSIDMTFLDAFLEGNT